MDSSLSPLSSAPASAPSLPLSSLSSTPSLPSSPVLQPDASGRYPSPLSSAPSGTQSPIKLCDPIDDSPRPAKKRRLAPPPRERGPMYLDLMKAHDEFTHEDNFHLQRLLSALRKKKKIVVIAGAGISVSAGIPDFRSPTGLFATARNQHRLKASGKHLFDASVYKHNSSTQSFHTMVREMAQMTKTASPTPFHHLLASLAKEGRLLRLYSQNIDCIETSMEPLKTSVPLEPKGPWPLTIQLHGGLQKMVCTKCGDLQPFNGELFNGPEAPLCEACEEQDQVRTTYAGKRSHGIGRLRPRIVLYNEYNPDEEAIGNVARADLKARPDAVLVVGTTLKVPGTRRLVKELCQVTRGRKDGFTAWINIDAEPKGIEFKDCWNLVVRSKCDNVARLAELPPFDCEIGTDYLVSHEHEEKMARRKTSIEVGIPSGSSSSPSCLSSPSSGIEVQLDAKPRQVEAFRAIPTPRPSPPVYAKKDPMAKSKQAKILFVGKKVEGSGQKPAKVSKPRARKPKQPAKAKAPPRNALQAFKARKNISDRDAGTKLGLDGPFPQQPLFKPEPDVGCSLPPLRPERRSSADNFLYKCGSSDDKLAETSSGAPSTPTMPERPLHRETISPRSVPNSMRDLIDVE
ncbi:NAD-dependent protein deacetylase hst4 [Tolypocladium ophioglossoides CBS 100239]|uniref:NAD-dependent protein deacetylase hst4 n=1 Tax=Tolypocladium ophioglossoides (strain CBS 100239) TaxID=1163406 RepID=A0A0L0NM94_TOLOC|nr:NAD-dependent protein deacetylase hst4 [Tolypocladium ophioglossoides CBS 100239]